MLYCKIDVKKNVSKVEIELLPCKQFITRSSYEYEFKGWTLIRHPDISTSLDFFSKEIIIGYDWNTNSTFTVKLKGIKDHGLKAKEFLKFCENFNRGL